MRFILLLLPLAWLVSGCTNATLDELRRADISGSAFNQELARLYLEFAENEATQYDWAAAQHFADKGLIAAYGNSVAPENPDNWQLSELHKRDAMTKREAIDAALTAEFYATHPLRAAQLIYYYDCWIEQMEEAWQENDIAICAEHMKNALEEAQRFSVAPQEEIRYADEGETISPVITATSYLLFFPWDEASIEMGQARLELSVLLDDLLVNPKAEIVVNGHADRSGSNDYNLALSQRRAEFVLRVLQQAGIAAERISYFAFGESDPRIPTEDGVQEPGNRRVEIFIE